MADIRSSINLIDNMSNVLNRITGKTNKMKQSIDNAKETMNKRDNFADNLSRDEQQLKSTIAAYSAQADKVKQLKEEYRALYKAKKQGTAEFERTKNNLIAAMNAEEKFAEAVERADNALVNQKNSMENNSRAANKLMGKVKQLAGYYLGFKGAKMLFNSTIGAAGDMVKQMGVIQAAFGNADVGRNYFNKMRLYAIETRNEISDLTDVTKNFMQLTKNTDKLMDLTDLANRLAMRTGNLGSAESLMQEAMRGEMNRLQRALHLTDDQVAPLTNAIKRGSLDGIIKAFDETLNHAGLDQKMAEAFYNNPKDKFGRALDTMKLQLENAGESALMALAPIADRLTAIFSSDKATQFFNIISGGLQVISEVFAWLFDKVTSGLLWIWELISSLWVFIEPILIAIAIVYLALIIQKLWAMLPALWAGTQAIFAQAMAWIIMHWQILVVIGSITLLIYMLMQTGVTAGQVIGYIIGGIMALGATIFNVVAFAWNLIASFAEFLVNVWNYPHYAMQKLWYDVQVAVLDFVIAGSDLLQGFADTAIEIANKVGDAFVNAFNWIINQAQKVSFSVPDWIPESLGGGKEFKLLGSVEKLSFTPYDNVDVAGWAKGKRANLKPPTKPAGAWSAPRMNYKNISAAYNKGQKWGEALPSKFTKGFENIQDSIKNFEDQERKWNAGQKDNLGKLNDKAGKGNKDRREGNKKKDKGNGKKDEIKKAIDKSNEELKWMRDIAEQEVINRFTTATLAPQISIAFGDIRETADVDGIVDHIENILTEQLNIAAEGVHR